MLEKKKSTTLRTTLFLAVIAVGCTNGDATRDSLEMGLQAPIAKAVDTQVADTVVFQEDGNFKRTVQTWADPIPQNGISYGSVQGVLTFRGNASRTFHGTGPIGDTATISWKYPKSAMCGKSSEYGETRTWCGTGWAGQPVVFERDSKTWVAFGAYDYKFHFLDAVTGKPIIEPLSTGDIAKGMLSVDPDGYPLLYGGSRDNFFRVIAIDGGKARVLWQIDGRAFKERMWNNDWDSAALVLNGHLIITGENGRIHVVELNRSYDKSGQVVVDPKMIWSAAGWDTELLGAIKDTRVSIESSPCVVGDVVYFANSGGLLQGWDLAPLRTGGEPKRVFRLWLGDDTDATIIADKDGYLYAAVEVDRGGARGKELGQLLKIDPKSNNPVVWGIDVNYGKESGSWATPALWENLVIFTTKPGKVIGVDKDTGKISWELKISGATLSSPNVVDDVLIQGDGSGKLRAWNLVKDKNPINKWTIQLGGNIESTAAVWKGSLYVGSRDGKFYKINTK